MEALLLTLDLVCMGMLLLGVWRVMRSGDVEQLGIFRYEVQRRGKSASSANATGNKAKPYA